MPYFIQLTAPAICQAFHPAAPFYAVGCVDGTLRVYQHDEDCQQFTLRHELQEAVGCRALSMKNEYLAYGLRDGQVVIATLEGFVEVMRVECPNGAPVMCLTWLSDELLCAGYEDGKMRCYNRTYRNSLRFEIDEFEEQVRDIVLHPDGDKFYAAGGGQLGLFNIAARVHHTRLLAMSDANDEEIECIGLFQEGKKILCCCADFGVAIFFQGDLGTHKERLSGLRFPVHTILKLTEEFFLVGGETGQVLVGQLYPNQWIGVFDELKLELPPSEDPQEDESDSLMSIDSMVADFRGVAVAFIDNCFDGVLVRSLGPARAIYQGKTIGKKTDYADFMDEL